jgi:hypothetical protein
MTATVILAETDPPTITLTAHRQLRWTPGWITTNRIVFPRGPFAVNPVNTVNPIRLRCPMPSQPPLPPQSYSPEVCRRCGGRVGAGIAYLPTVAMTIGRPGESATLVPGPPKGPVPVCKCALCGHSFIP